MILLVDNRDSFTYNLSQSIQMQGYALEVMEAQSAKIDVCRSLNPSHIVIGPGPGRPEDARFSLEIIETMKELPILGVCLGHQALALSFGAKIVRGERIMHGRQSTISHDGRGIFEGMPQNFLATRYHSLLIDPRSLPEELEVSAYSEMGEIMGVRHKEYPLEGVQFHPESVMTESGAMIFRNFLNLKLKAFA